MNKYLMFNFQSYIKYYDIFLISAMFIGGFSMAFVLPWYMIILAYLMTYVISTAIISTIYHKLWCHKSFEPKSWVNWFGAITGFIFFLGLPGSYAIMHLLHHKDPNDPEHPQSPKHPLRYRLFHWIYGHKFKLSDEYQKKTKIIAEKFFKSNKWALQVNLKRRLIIIHFAYLIFYLIGPHFFAFMLLTSALSNLRGILFNIGSHWYDKNGKQQTLNSKLVSVLLWSDEAFHQEHHDFPRRAILGSGGPAETSKFIINIYSKQSS